MHDLDAAPLPRVLEIRFTGSGSEYFRIWAVNLLLILLSCGLYLPFAKARRIRYFHSNTLVDGEALAFHGDAWKMFRGFVLLAVLTLAYTFAGEFSPAAAVPALLLLCTVWPPLWRASMQFRLANTSWRGLRLGFEGSMRAAYLAFLPVFVPWVLIVALTPDGSGPSSDPGINTSFWFWTSLAAATVMAPWSAALIKRYQHCGYRIAGEHSRIELCTSSVYGLAIKTLLLGLLMLPALVAATMLLGGLMALVATGKIDAKGNGVYYGLAAAGSFYLLLGSVVLPFYASRLQNLVWNRTHAESLQFRCEMRGLVRLTLKNWLLIVVSLGLYRPFAVIAAARLRLQSMQIETRSDPATWVAGTPQARDDASGEIAGDFFGVDVGL